MTARVIQGSFLGGQPKLPPPVPVPARLPAPIQAKPRARPPGPPMPAFRAPSPRLPRAGFCRAAGHGAAAR